MMKRLYALLFSICMLVVFSVPLGASAAVEENTPVVNERIVNILKKNNIGYTVEKGNVKLVNTSPEAISKVNQLLASEFNPSLLKAAASYPTAYVHMKAHDIQKNKKFTAALKTALGAAVIEWAKNGGLPDPRKISVAAVGGFGVYYFVQTDTENLYFSIKYYYRELSAGKFDMNGNFVGDYEIKKEIRVTKNSDYTGGNIGLDVRKSSILDPFF
ncbi:hypothetical protein [Brevibacillus sp. NRS-1366]|uniref:hypothetical protein n=1 Tax=Brevibacillus sp. NRS-1366 TaxID=3233899 RepID=UPI003D197923